MPRYLFLAAITLLCSIQGLAQSKINWTGKVVDSTTKEILELATVSVNDVRDSSLVTYTLTDSKGYFKLEGLPLGKTLNLLISYTGYKHYRRSFKVEEGGRDFGPIILAPSSKSLNEVVIEGERPPIAIRQDTIEFNAASFKTKPNAVVEDLLKKLPGVDVDKDGAITVNGKKVSRVLVDGKEFFGGDPKIATKNLPKDIVDKIQVMDTKTKVEELTGKQASGDEKTINISLKEDKKKGVFGRINAGAGTQNRYDASASINMFNKKRQLSFLGAANNLNSTGFTLNDIMSMLQSSGQQVRSVSVSYGSSGASSMSVNGISVGGGAGGDGIRKVYSGGLNYNDELSKDLKLNSSYFFNRGDGHTERSSNRVTTNTDTAFTDSQWSIGDGINDNHRLNLGVNYNIDSMTTLSVNPSFEYTKGNNFTRSHSERVREDGLKINNSDINNNSEAESANFRNSLSLVRLLNKNGKSLSFEFNNSYNTSNSDVYYNAHNEFFQTGIDTTINQYARSRSTIQSYGGTLTYTQPLSKTWKMDLRYMINYNRNEMDKNTFNYNETSKGYDDPDPAFSDKFRSVTVQQKPEISFNYSGKKLRSTFGSGLLINSLDNFSYTQDRSIKINQVSLVPTMRTNYQLTKSSSLNLNYWFFANQPTADQLQPVQDNSNPLYKRLGNPDLKNALSHSFSLGYNMFNMNKGYNIFANLSFNPTSNSIQNETTLNEVTGEQVSRPVNVDGNYSTNMNVNFSKTKKTKNSNYRISLMSNGGINKTLTFTNRIKAGQDTIRQRNEVNGFNIGPGINFTYGYKELFEIVPSYRLNYRKSKYSIASMNDAEQITHTMSLGTSLYWPKKFIWENDINFTYNNNIAPGYRKGVTLWNMAISRQVLKNDKGLVKLMVYDVLNQNTSVRRNIGSEFIEDSQTLIVKQYFMLSFTYNISSFGGATKAPRRSNNGGMIMF